MSLTQKSEWHDEVTFCQAVNMLDKQVRNKQRRTAFACTIALALLLFVFNTLTNKYLLHS